MKKIVLLFILPFLFGSCYKDFLEITPTNQEVVTNFYKIDDDAFKAVNAAYAFLKAEGTYRTRLGTLDMLTDNDLVSWSYSDGKEIYELKEGNTLTINNYIGEVWQAGFIGISRANQVIRYVAASATISPDVKKRTVAEAHFLRALYYFNLVRLYGDVPLILEPAESVDPAKVNVKRTPLAEVYAQIIEDLKHAAANLPEVWNSADAGRATSGSANGMLAKVFLTLATRDYGDKYRKKGNEYNEVVNYAQKVINKVPAVYDLMPEYKDNFDPSLIYENCKESLFEVQMSNTVENGGKQSILMAPRSWTTQAGGWGFCQPTREFARNYETGDKRKTPTIFSHGDAWTYKNTGGEWITPFIYDSTKYDTRTGHNTRKFLVWWQDDIWERCPMNIQVMRLPDVYLMFAEAQLALGHQSDADTYVNKVRHRAGISDLSNVTLAQVINERRMELAFENDRYFDLLRTNSLITVMNTQLMGDLVRKIELTKRNLYWPIPQSEIDANPNLVQNDGY